MLAFFLIVLIVPLVIAGIAFVALDGISLKEFGLIVVVELLIAGTSAGVCSCANTHDVEVWNGVVTKKQKETVSCSHSYQCRCHEECTGSGKSRSCSEKCDTCYEHFNDYDWDVYTSNGENIEIDRVDRQGVIEPPRFKAVRIGEPTSVTHSYKNYVKASPDSLFRHQGLKEKYASVLPNYPGNVYDYYHLDRLVTSGVTVPDARAWNNDLTKANADLGLINQVNMIVVLVRNQPRDFFYALQEAWIGGKKNDVVAVISVDDSMKPQWTEVMAWTNNELFKVKLRDDIMAQDTLQREAVMTALRKDVSTSYQRKPMKDFEYLTSSITPTTTEWIITLLLGFIAAGVLVFICQTNDVFGDEFPHRRRFRRSYSF